MTNSNKILLSTLLQIEKSLNETENYINKASLPISIEFHFSNFYNLFQTITSAFSIPQKNYDKLCTLLDSFLDDKLSIPQIIEEIEKLIWLYSIKTTYKLRAICEIPRVF